MPQSSVLAATVAEALPLPFCTYPRAAETAAREPRKAGRQREE